LKRSVLSRGRRLKTPLGIWATDKLMQGWHYHPESNQLYHQQAGEWRAHPCTRDSSSRAIFSMASCPAVVPEGLWMAMVQITEQAILCTGKGEIKSTSTHSITTFIDALLHSPTN
jgi:hypothetical protein